ncbi:MAG: alpha/beta hydrolase [Myxococcota bacterium]|nr:alpha/beta hydrolase [Myxococcota bacterium]
MSDYAYDPDFEKLLPFLPTTQDFSTAEKIQKVRDARADMFPPPADREDVVKEDWQIQAAETDPKVPVRVYRKKDGRPAPRPGLVEIHGGGFMLGSIDMIDAWCQLMASALDIVIVSVEYRLAPEDPFPAGLEDCYAALCWTAKNASELGIDASRIGIAGQSAGGGLAAGTALAARDRGGPKLCFQLLEIPELDDRLDTPSMKAFTDTPLWNHPNAIWSWKHYLGPDHPRGEGEVSPYAAPARAEDVSGLPPAYVSTMEFDPLRDEGLIYATRMLQAGVSVELHSYAGTFHGSGLLAEAEPSKHNVSEVMRVLRRGLGLREETA